MIKRRTNVEILALGFAIVILVGTFLLLLPISSNHTDFLDALFTATSATCVTGLVVYDTATHWTLFGQIVILILIQIGGLGFITIGVFLATYLKKKISLRQRGLIEESVSSLKLAGGVKLVKHIIKGTFLFEGIGAVILSLVFIEDFGLLKGIYLGIFHSVSAFCNAGFDLLGIIEPYGSLTPYASNIVVNITIMILIIIGGLGFVVWQDLYEKKLHFRNYLLQTKIVLITSFIFIFGGAFLFYIFEYQHALASLSSEEAILASFFQSITCRTAGFNTIDVSHLKPATSLLMMLMMFVGGSPGSTAGGIKTTTFAVLIIFVYSTMTNKSEANAFNRRFDSKTIKKACSVFLINFIFIIISSFIIFNDQPHLPMQDTFFEIFSALGTVGISTGITRVLSMTSKITIILLMYCGRVGSLTLALSLSKKKKISNCKNPVEKISIG
ncbi:Trk family potassium uptake protein [Coprobacillus sp. TM10-10]|jgi:trk system potassium uptake protein TrkH|uniref:Potassium transporter TrkH n=1 Tax=Faecalibacillus intestinalis TaxID=1982626 RepID=A0A2T3G4I5_9FIRM|nr:TrkH family potassium uptake protein [Faecalibacillus intestinalis]RGG96732.1 Trk family potassium uptake protein [Coprobacillus sp. AF16-47]RGI06519.1 Trk family potassium uptake protein [Coprobacillus sp. TM10-10]RHR91043.1 Trk family potassium uptake protein [Coprobacillus sp. AF15-30]PST42447.1 Trk family potassium uptake protein [Faecalibacillus intestinalis]BCL58472.1 potassium transporter TrkH [Faecalibacillus intestinalis]